MKKSGKIYAGKNASGNWGLTLAELLVILLLLAIVAVIAIPDFLTFQAKTCNSEHKQNLASIFMSQINYREKNGEFASHDGYKRCFELLGWEPDRCSRRYSYYCDTDIYLSQTKDENKCPLPKFYNVTKDSFTIVAVGNIDTDPDCDVWTINDAKELVHVHNDLDRF